jgi:protein-L-isoaspartate(D-aspartate) O-methyltransferase
MESVRPFVQVADAASLPFAADGFDLVVSINTLHILLLPELERALLELERVATSDGGKYLVLDGYRNDAEKINLMYWHLTCECFFTPDEWQWLFDRVGFSGDFECIYYT